VSAVISIEQISVYRLIIRFVVYNQLISGGRLRQHLALAVIEQDLANGKFLFVQKFCKFLFLRKEDTLYFHDDCFEEGAIFEYVTSGIGVIAEQK